MLLAEKLLLFLVLLAGGLSQITAEQEGDVSVTINIREDGDTAHPRYKRHGYRRRKKKERGKGSSEVNLTFNFPNGTTKDIKMLKQAKITPKIPEIAIENGDRKQVVKSSVVAEKEIAIFKDPTSDLVLARECDEESCKIMVGLDNDDGTSLFEGVGNSSYLNKTMSTKGVGPLPLSDERALGKKKDGTPLDFENTPERRRRRDLLLSSKMKAAIKNRRRKKREIGPYVIELLILVDHTEYQFWVDRCNGDTIEAERTIQLYLILLANMRIFHNDCAEVSLILLDQRFASLSSVGIDLTVMINGIVYLKTEADSPWITDNLKTASDGSQSVDVDEALDGLTEYLHGNRHGLPPNDHVLAITRMDLTGDSGSGPLGAAWTGGMCTTDYSVSLIQDPGFGLEVFAAAHELCHSLKSSHDPDISLDGCNADDYYLMGPRGGSPQGSDSLSNTNKEPNPFSFSECSKRAIKNFIVKLNTDQGNAMCLGVHTYNKTMYDSYKTMPSPGVFIPVNVQCELMYGDGSRRCFANEPINCADGVWCWNPANPSFCHILYAAEGTLCDDRRRCHFNECVESSIVSGTCPPNTDNPLPVTPLYDETGGYTHPSYISTTVTPYMGTAEATWNSYVESADPIC